jgi:NAD(P)-dependent dehydrogenase (short-subunit alcohol dehydrogenase family)
MMTRAIGVRMVKRGSGSIVTIASIAGMQAWPVHAYGPAKAALINLMQGLAAEWGCDGVRVNCISPGFVRTPGTERGLSEKLMDAEVISKHTALKRLLEPNEVATAAAFLLSNDSGGITGINLPVDAGFLAAAHWGAFGVRPNSD